MVQQAGRQSSAAGAAIDPRVAAWCGIDQEGALGLCSRQAAPAAHSTPPSLLFHVLWPVCTHLACMFSWLEVAVVAVLLHVW